MREKLSGEPMGDMVFTASNDLGILFIQVSCLTLSSPGSSIRPPLVLQEQDHSTPPVCTHFAICPWDKNNQHRITHFAACF